MDVSNIKLNDGREIPQLGLGVWKAADGGEAERAVAAAIAAGYRLIDTAMVYLNEHDVGRAIAASDVSRDQLYITTKLWNSDQGSENVRPALEASLKRLGLDFVDLYLIHWPMPGRDLYVETWREFITLRDAGLTKSIGVSNFNIEHLERLERETGVIPAVNQVEIHPGFAQTSLREYCASKGILVESWSPIGGVKGSVLGEPTIIAMAEKYQKSPAQVAIRWHIQHGLVVIPKSVHEERIRENIDVYDFALSDEDMAALDALPGRRIGPDPAEMNHNYNPRIIRAATNVQDFLRR